MEKIKSSAEDIVEFQSRAKKHLESKDYEEMCNLLSSCHNAYDKMFNVILKESDKSDSDAKSLKTHLVLMYAAILNRVDDESLDIWAKYSGYGSAFWDMIRFEKNLRLYEQGELNSADQVKLKKKYAQYLDSFFTRRCADLSEEAINAKLFLFIGGLHGYNPFKIKVSFATDKFMFSGMVDELCSCSEVFELCDREIETIEEDDETKEVETDIIDAAKLGVDKEESKDTTDEADIPFEEREQYLDYANSAFINSHDFSKVKLDEFYYITTQIVMGKFAKEQKFYPFKLAKTEEDIKHIYSNLDSGLRDVLLQTIYRDTVIELLQKDIENFDKLDVAGKYRVQELCKYDEGLNTMLQIRERKVCSEELKQKNKDIRKLSRLQKRDGNEDYYYGIQNVVSE